MKNRIFLLLLAIGLATAIVLDDDSCDSDEYGSSSGSHEGGGRGGGRGRGRGGGRGNRPRTTVLPATPAPYCQPGWTLVRRVSGGWCVRVFAGVVNQAQAQTGCANQGAVLSSVESAAERQTIYQLGTALMATTGWKHGTLRLGMIRATKASPFVMTDGFTIGMEGVAWSPGEPSGGSTEGLPHNCGMLWLWQPGGLQTSRIPGTMFSMVCPKTWNDRFRGYVCGKRAM